MLVGGLPPEAATWREEHEWTWERELAAAQIEVADRWGRILAVLAHAKPDSLPEPVRIPRPGDEPIKPVKPANQKSVAEFARAHARSPERG